MGFLCRQFRYDFSCNGPGVQSRGRIPFTPTRLQEGRANGQSFLTFISARPLYYAMTKTKTRKPNATQSLSFWSRFAYSRIEGPVCGYLHQLSDPTRNIVLLFLRLPSHHSLCRCVISIIILVQCLLQ